MESIIHRTFQAIPDLLTVSNVLFLLAMRLTVPSEPFQQQLENQCEGGEQ